MVMVVWRKFKSLAIIGGCAIACTPASADQGSIGLVAGTGQNNSAPALALVIPSSTSAALYDLSPSLQNLPGWGTGGVADGCALNGTGSVGLVAGQGQDGFAPALALVIPSSTSAALYDLSTSLLDLPGWGTAGEALGCALNGIGSVGLVAGKGQNFYAPALALVIPSSTSAALYDLSTSLKNLPGWGTTSGALGCALNGAGSVGLVAGQGQNFNAPALALVIPSSTSAALYDLSTSLIDLPGWGTDGVADACALNGTGSVGFVAGRGQNNSAPALALVIPSSTSAALYDLSTSLKNLPGWGTGGEADACALNGIGSVGLVAGQGQNNTAPALALVIPSSTSAALYDLSTSLKDLPGWGTGSEAFGCALNGIGSIGLVAGQGQNNTAPALALIIPSSTSAALYDLSTSLKNLPGWGTTGFAFGCALNSLTPTTIGTYTSSVLYTMMTESSTLQAHASYERMRIQRLSRHPSSESAYLAEAEPPEQVKEQADDFSTRELHFPALSAEAPYDIWLMPFGDLLHQAKEGSLPSFTNQVAGGLLGFDAQCGKEGVVGGSLGYAFDYVHYGAEDSDVDGVPVGL